MNTIKNQELFVSSPLRLSAPCQMNLSCAFQGSPSKLPTNFPHQQKASRGSMKCITFEEARGAGSSLFLRLFLPSSVALGVHRNPSSPQEVHLNHGSPQEAGMELG